MRQVTTTLVDDLTPTQPAAETVKFGCDSIWYEIDLTEKHADDLRRALAKYIAAARRVGGRKSTRRKAGTKKS